MNIENRLDLIEKHAAGDLNKQEQQLFERLMSNDPLFVEEVKLFHAMQQTINREDVQDLEIKIENILVRHRSTIKKRMWPILAIAASTLIVGFLFWQWIIQPYKFDKMVIADAGLPAKLRLAHFQSRGIAKDNDRPLQAENNDELTLYFDHYNNGQFELAIETLNTIDVDSAGSFANKIDYFYYYKGITYMQLEQYNAALQALQLVNSSDLKQVAEWYQAVCLFGLEGSSPKTIEALRAIEQQGKVHPRWEKANGLLHKLLKN